MKGALPQTGKDQVEAYVEGAHLAVRSFGQVLVAMLREVRVVVPGDLLHELRNALGEIGIVGVRVRDLPERETEDEPVEQVIDVVLPVGVKPGIAEPAEEELAIREAPRSHVSPGHQQPRRPWVAAQALVDGARGDSDRIDRIGLGRGEFPLREDEVEHAVEQIVFVRDMAVKRQCFVAELIPQPAHCQGLDPGAVGKVQRRARDSFSIERDPVARRHLA